jgi:hypothetical protein
MFAPAVIQAFGLRLCRYGFLDDGRQWPTRCLRNMARQAFGLRVGWQVGAHNISICGSVNFFQYGGLGAGGAEGCGVVVLNAAAPGTRAGP